MSLSSEGRGPRRTRSGRGGHEDDARDLKRRGGRPRRTRMPPEEIPPRHPQRGRGHTPEQSFTCGHCKRFVGPLPSGGHHRNHCPFCLYSRHVDEGRSGDRASACKSLMAPTGAFQRPNGEHVIVHRCLGCGFERFNRIAADDDFDLVLALPVVPPRSSRLVTDVIGSTENAENAEARGGRGEEEENTATRAVEEGLRGQHQGRDERRARRG